MSGPLTGVKVYGQSFIDNAHLHGVVGFHLPPSGTCCSISVQTSPFSRTSRSQSCYAEIWLQEQVFGWEGRGQTPGRSIVKRVAHPVRPVCSLQARQVCVYVGLKCISLEKLILPLQVQHEFTKQGCRWHWEGQLPKMPQKRLASHTPASLQNTDNLAT